MQELITSYLFQNKVCPLPGLGTLTVSTKPSVSDFVHKQILAPEQGIQFNAAESDTADLLNYICVKEGCTNNEASDFLNKFSAELKNGRKLAGIGKFTVNASGNIVFEKENLPAYFTPPVYAERVIHPEADHNILVGDKETTSAVMTEYYAEESPKRSYWWVWAIVLAAVAVAVIVIYLNDKNSSATFGNAVDYRLA